MTGHEHSRDLPKFREVDRDRYILISKIEPALIAAWQVLQALEIQQHGESRFYTDDSKASTLDYLSSGGEERPFSGIFDVSIHESWEHDNMVDLNVLNSNGRGNEDYRTVLKSAVSAVGIEEQPS